MGRGVVKNLLTFVLVLAVTVGSVALLSRVTSAKAETAPARYTEQVRQAQSPAAGLSAQMPEESLSPLVSVGGFLAVLAVSGAAAGAGIRAARKEARGAGR